VLREQFTRYTKAAITKVTLLRIVNNVQIISVSAWLWTSGFFMLVVCCLPLIPSSHLRLGLACYLLLQVFLISAINDISR